MRTQTQNKYVTSFGWSLVVASVLSALLVVLKEKSEATMNLMKTATGHHWITHGITVLVVFVVLGFVLAMLCPNAATKSDLNRIAVAVVVATIVSGLIIAGFSLLS